MAEECGSLERQLREAREARDAQHRVNAELAAELQRLAAESALGPVLALDKDGRVRRGWQSIEGWGMGPCWRCVENVVAGARAGAGQGLAGEKETRDKTGGRGAGLMHGQWGGARAGAGADAGQGWAGEEGAGG